MRLPGKFFIAASHRHSASLSEEVCPLHVYTLHPVAFVHFEPFPAALTWILTRITLGCPVGAGEMPDRVGHDGAEARQMLFTLLTLSSSDMSLSSGTINSASWPLSMRSATMRLAISRL